MKPTQQQIIEFCHSNTIIDYLKIKVLPKDGGGVQFEFTVDECHTNFLDICHGGVLTTMADTAMGSECIAQNKSVVTMNLSIDFLHAAAIDKKIIAVPKIIHNGRKTMVCECDMIDDSGKLFSKVHATFFVVGEFIKSE